VQLATAQILYEPGDVIHHIHFPTSAFVSLVSTADGHDGLQTGMVGNEGAPWATSCRWTCRARRCGRWCRVRAWRGG
jgi:hypothetical protein